MLNGKRCITYASVWMLHPANHKNLHFQIKIIMKKLLLHLSVAALVFGAVVFADEEEDKKESVGTVIGIDLGTTYSW